jgi:hypothetical protein
MSSFDMPTFLNYPLQPGIVPFPAPKKAFFLSTPGPEEAHSPRKSPAFWFALGHWLFVQHGIVSARVRVDCHCDGDGHDMHDHGIHITEPDEEGEEKEVAVVGEPNAVLSETTKVVHAKHTATCRGGVVRTRRLGI